MGLLSVAQGVTAAKDLTVTDGQAATDGKNATDGSSATESAIPTDDQTATDSRTATDGAVATAGTAVMEEKAATEGQATLDRPAALDNPVSVDNPISVGNRAATEGAIAADGKMLAVGAPETGLKSAALPADTITRTQVVPANTLPRDLGLQVIGKPSERRTQSSDTDAALPLPTTVPAQAGAAGTEAKPLTASERAEMVRQVAEGVGMTPLPAKPGASQQMTLQLHPQDWGQLQITVKVVSGTDTNAPQTVTAHIVAETPQVKAALDNGSGDLRQALRTAGLNLDRISVTVQRMEASAQAGTATSGGRHEASHGGAGPGWSKPGRERRVWGSGVASEDRDVGWDRDVRYIGQWTALVCRIRRIARRPTGRSAAARLYGGLCSGGAGRRGCAGCAPKTSDRPDRHPRLDAHLWRMFEEKHYDNHPDQCQRDRD